MSMVTERLNEYQMDGLRHSLKPPGGVGIITGPPGTGKTYLIVALTKVLVMLGHKVLLCAPSNEATDHLAMSINTGFPDLNVCRVYRPAAEEHQHRNWRSNEIDEDELIGQSNEVVNTIAQIKGDRRNRMAHKELSLIMRCVTLAMDIEEGRCPRPTVRISETESGPLQLDAFLEVCHAYEANRRIPGKTMKKSGKQLRQLAACILKSASVVVTTCNSADSRDLRQFYQHSVVIYDEAAQTDEPDTLIALTRESVKAVILVGDTNQLRPIVVSTSQNEFAHQLERSLQARLLSINYPSVLLRIQYRMLPSISFWPNQTFYHGQLTDGSSTSFDSRPLAEVFSQFLRAEYGIRSRTNRLLVAPTLGGQATRSPSGSLSNNGNLNLMVSMVVRLTTRHSFDPTKISIISFYEQQRLNYAHVLESLQLLQPALRVKLQGISVATVDSFQGKENEITFLDLVTDGGEVGGEVGFVRDERRLNVACTRARCGLVIVGDVNMCNPRNSRRPEARNKFLQALFDSLRQEKSVYQLGYDDNYSSIVETGSFGGRLVPEPASLPPVFSDELSPDNEPPEDNCPPDQDMRDVDDAPTQSSVDNNSDHVRTPYSLDLEIPPTPGPVSLNDPSTLNLW
ncbi:hypothetical protein GP486_004073 [Trichoglossum hirsutum]|uniref:AAA+ ATPase domain-containing protein n=1 Tax=Trichoglossum hirsutum TaxID=265104 RepID=A0A9P8LBV6_9PEZI|nr:hypothetical protein GP486_004073 [Trichoglossum hirsutum]